MQNSEYIKEIKRDKECFLEENSKLVNEKAIMTQQIDELTKKLSLLEKKNIETIASTSQFVDDLGKNKSPSESQLKTDYANKIEELEKNVQQLSEEKVKLVNERAIMKQQIDELTKKLSLLEQRQIEKIDKCEMQHQHEDKPDEIETVEELKVEQSTATQKI